MGLREWMLQDLEASRLTECYEDKNLKLIWQPMIQQAYDAAIGAGIAHPYKDDVSAFLLEALRVNKAYKKCRDGKIKRPAKKWDAYWADYLLERGWDGINKSQPKE